MPGCGSFAVAGRASRRTDGLERAWLAKGEARLRFVADCFLFFMPDTEAEVIRKGMDGLRGTDNQPSLALTVYLQGVLSLALSLSPFVSLMNHPHRKNFRMRLQEVKSWSSHGHSRRALSGGA